jgi:hypothetical protein
VFAACNLQVEFIIIHLDYYSYTIFVACCIVIFVLLILIMCSSVVDAATRFELNVDS